MEGKVFKSINNEYVAEEKNLIGEEELISKAESSKKHA